MPKSWESAKGSGDTYAAIYESMLLSDAYLDLNNRQRVLLLHAKAQFYGKRKPGDDFKQTPEVQGDDVFYLNRYLLVKHYRLYSDGNRQAMYEDIKALMDHGFITRISRGTKSKSIYRFSPQWRTWTKKKD